MNEKNDYAEMLEIPVNTCNIVYKPDRKKVQRRKKLEKLEEVKERLLNQINSPKPVEKAEENAEIPQDDTPGSTDFTENIAPERFDYSSVVIKPKKKRAFRFNIITLQLALIAVLFGVIVLSSALIKDSGINVFFSNVLSSGAETTETVKNYSEYEISLPYAAESMSLESGVVSIDCNGSVYLPCNGYVSAITEENGKFSIEVTHGKNFKSILKGVDYAYRSIGEKVYYNVPLGYALDESVQLCFFADDAMITDYQLNEKQIVWQV